MCFIASGRKCSRHDFIPHCIFGIPASEIWHKESFTFHPFSQEWGGGWRKDDASSSWFFLVGFISLSLTVGCITVRAVVTWKLNNCFSCQIDVDIESPVRGVVIALLFFMVAVCNRADHIYFPPVVCSFFSFFSSPNLSGQRLDVCHTSTHRVALVRI